MDKSDFWEKFSQWFGCGCYLIPVVLIVGSIVIGLLNRDDVEAAKQAQRIKDSVARIENLDSIKTELEVRDMITEVIFREGDSLYHYYINCLHMHGFSKLEVIKRSEAKKMGLKSCADCRDIEDYYLEKVNLRKWSEKHLEFLKDIYSKP